MNRLSRMLPAIVAWLLCCPLFAQQSVDLSGRWDFAMGDAPRYNDHVTLPGSMLTNGKGNPVTAHTVWTGSTYDSSYYFNPYMEQYRREAQCQVPVLPHARHPLCGSCLVSPHRPCAPFVAGPSRGALPRAAPYRDHRLCQRPPRGPPAVALHAPSVRCLRLHPPRAHRHHCHRCL